MRITLNTMDAIRDFVKTVSRFDNDINIKSRINSVNAKSIMGIFTLDLSKPVEVIANGENPQIVYNAIEKYVA